MQYIFIHGLGQTPECWEETIAHMDLQAETVCPGLPELLRHQEVTYENLFQTFCGYCNRLTGPLNLCGLSLGAVLALHYGIENPEKVGSLALIAAQYAMPKRLLRLQNTVFRCLPKPMFRQMGFQKSDFIRLTESMMDLDFSGDLERLACPVLILCGGRDRANRQAAQQLAQRIPHAAYRTIEGAGHEVNLDAAEKLAEILRAFYQSLSEKGSGFHEFHLGI